MGKRKRRKENHLLRLAIALMELFTAMLTLLIAIFQILKELIKD